MNTDLLSVNLINNNLQAKNKKELFKEMAKMLFENNKIDNLDEFIADLEVRESLSITSMDGIAYPHAKSYAVIEPGIAVGVKRQGIKYEESNDINPDPTVFFMIASPNDNSRDHVEVIQGLFKKFSPEFIKEIHKATDEKQILSILLKP